MTDSVGWLTGIEKMKNTIIFIILLFLLFTLHSLIYAQNNLQNRFSPPPGFARILIEPNSFADWLQELPLQEPGSPVLDFRGREFKKAGDSTVAAVVDIDISGKRLEQCMDILLRFYSEYLIEQGQQDSIQFPLPDGLMLSWKEWQVGWRPFFKGLNFQLKKTAQTDNSQNNFKRYLAEIYSYSGSQTFYHYYPQIPVREIKAGDFLVRRKRKGHAILIMDVVENAQGQKMVMVGQGDTPACQFYILNGKNGSPWFPLNASSGYLPLPIKKKMYWRGLRRFPAYSN